jgi:beta-lactam-binding protein with PASTA domain
VAAVSLVAVLASPSEAQAQVESERDTTRVPSFLEALEVEPLVLVAGRRDVRLALEVTAWGRRTSLPDSVTADSVWSFHLAVEGHPSFLSNLTWEEGEQGILAAGERSFEAHLSFDVDSAATGGGGPAELTLLVSADDADVIPAERRIVIPLEVRGRPASTIAAHPLSWKASREYARLDEPEPFSRVLPEVEPLVFDQVWAFFTPAVDTADDFSWRIVTPAGDVASSGERIHGSEENSALSAGPGAPGAFVTGLQRGRVWDPKDPDRGAGPGTYRLEVCEKYDEETGGGGVFGTGASLPACVTWREEASFEIGSRQLHLKGLVLEQGAAAVERRWTNLSLPVGALRFLEAPVDPEARSASFEAEWFAPAAQAFLADSRPDRDPETPLRAELLEAVPDGDLRRVVQAGPEGGNTAVLAFHHRVTGSVELDLPAVLDPMHDPLGVVGARLTVSGSGFFGGSCGGVGFQFPTSKCGRSDPVTVSARVFAPVAAVGPPGRVLVVDGDTAAPAGPPPGPGEDEWWSMSDPWGVLETSGSRIERPSVPTGGSLAVNVHWQGWSRDGAIPGREGSRFGALVRREGVAWYLPVELRLGEATLYAFAVYGVEPGPYEGPLPEVPESERGGTDNLVATGPTPEAPGGGGNPTAGGNPAVGGDPTVVGRPPGGGDPRPDSVAGAGAADPSGGGGNRRAGDQPGAPVPLPDLVGRPVAAAMAELEALGLEADVEVGAAATRSDQAFTVVSQRPASGEAPVEGEPVHLVICGDFVAMATVPEVLGDPVGDARARLEAIGLEVLVEVAAAATSAGDAFTVVRQTPAPGGRLATGESVLLEIRGPYTNVVTVPDVRTHTSADAESQLRGLGLTPVTRITAAAATAEASERVLSQSPAPGSRVAPGTAVALTANDRWVEPVQPRSVPADPVLPSDRQTQPVGPPAEPNPPRREDPPPPVVVPADPEPQPFRLADPSVLRQVCPASVTLRNGAVLQFRAAEGSSPESSFSCAYGAEPGQGAGTGFGWRYQRFYQPSGYTLCRATETSAIPGQMYSDSHDLEVWVARDIQNWEALLLYALHRGEELEVAVPCRRR